MGSEQSKGHREIDVFLEFAEKAPLRIDPKTVVKRLPPAPDILCQSDEGPLAFELVEICDARLAKHAADASRAEEGGVAYIRTADPSVEIIRKKLTCNYDTTHSVDLLCYNTGRVVSPDTFIVSSLAPWFSSGKHPFRRAWLLGRKRVYLIWTAGQQRATPNAPASRITLGK